MAKNSAMALAYVGVFVYLFYFAIVALINGTFFTPVVLTYVFVSTVIWTRVWPNAIYAILLPWTEWKMYKRDYLRLNRVYRKVLGLGKPFKLNSYAEIVTRCNLANIQLQLGEYEDAEEIYRHCFALLQKMRPDNRYKSVRQLYGVYISCGLGVALCHQEKFLEASLVVAEVFDAITAKQFNIGLYEGYAYYLLGHTNLGLKDDSAEENVLKAAQLIRAVKPAPGIREHSRSQMLNACNLALARIYFESSRIDEANKFHDQFFADLDEGRSTISPLGVKDMSVIAEHLLKLHDYARAEKTLQLCYFLMSPTPFAPLAKQTLGLYERLLNETGRADEVLDLKSWLHPVSLLTHM